MILFTSVVLPFDICLITSSITLYPIIGLVISAFDTRKGTDKAPTLFSFKSSNSISTYPVYGTGVLLAAISFKSQSSSRISDSSCGLRFGKFSRKNLSDKIETWDPVSHKTIDSVLPNRQETSHSTLTCLLKMSDDWYNGLDLGKLVGLVFIDLKKAFDTVDHDILCKKLELYGVQQRELSWFKSYLSNRKQFCRVNGVDSDIGEIEVGVPQGSCLGPLLFLIYINDLPEAVQGASVTMYADDTTLSHQSHDLTQLNEAINSDLSKLETWLQGNKLSLNVAKNSFNAHIHQAKTQLSQKSK